MYKCFFYIYSVSQFNTFTHKHYYQGSIIFAGGEGDQRYTPGTIMLFLLPIMLCSNALPACFFFSSDPLPTCAQKSRCTAIGTIMPAVLRHPGVALLGLPESQHNLHSLTTLVPSNNEGKKITKLLIKCDTCVMIFFPVAACL